MASQALFQDLPPFPEDVPVASMKKVPLAGLRSGDEATAKEVFAACQELGFFLLDLYGDDMGEETIAELDQLFSGAKDIMDTPEDVKAKYLHNIPKNFLGFKPRGHAKTETGEYDRFEWFNLGQDGLMKNTPLQPLPPAVESRVTEFTSFLKHGQTIADTINSSLATQLGLPAATFSALQPPTAPSGTVIRLIKAFASPEAKQLRTSMHHHTDFGSITLLANVVGGLQVLAPGKSPQDEGAWLWVRPQPGCLIVNLGDAMVKWTGGLLRSNIHRVNHAPGQQRYVDRYSLAILFRPTFNASMKKLTVEGEEEDVEDANLTARQWEINKTMSLATNPGSFVWESKGGKPPAAAIQVAA
ncbi:oxidoreductase [Xylariaceae sp. FL0016]|nr:oxidoreductase [Xylariaceae sp. FL0016]